MKKGTTEMTLAELRVEHKKSLKRLLAFEKRNHAVLAKCDELSARHNYMEKQLLQCSLNEKEVA